MQKTETDRQRAARKIQNITAVFFIGTGIILGNISEHYGEVKVQEAKALAALAAEQKAGAMESTVASKKKEEQEQEVSAQKEKAKKQEQPKPYKPAPDKLNLAYFYPDDAESEEVIDSYAGQVFQELMVMDLDWLSNLYELSDISPSTMASRLGKSQKSIMGGYNPRDKAHRAGDPSSWVIHDWKKIHVNFIDGDGRAIDGFSNVKDILSMASVYTYYTDMMDVDGFAEYSRQLWKDSHSYRLSMGDFYYCSGCLNKTEEELVREAEADELAANTSIAASKNRTETEIEDSSSETDSDSSLESSSESGLENPEETLPVGEPAEQVDGQTLQGFPAGEKAEQTDGQAWQGDGQTPSSQESSSDMIQEETLPQSTPDALKVTPTETPPQPSSEVGQTETLPQPSSERIPAETSPETIQSETNSVSIPDGVNGEKIASDSDAETESSASREDEGNQRITTQYDCPGHVDLYIQVKILGLNEKKGLYSLASAAGTTKTESKAAGTVKEEKDKKDKAEAGSKEETVKESREKAAGGSKKETAENAEKSKEKSAEESKEGKEKTGEKEEKIAEGNTRSAGNEQKWEGWTKKNIASANKISNLDWFDDYGLSISSISVSTPLSNQEIDTYMNQLPANTSVTRRNVVHFALSSVGRVPYYWGGKAAAPGYEGNNFGALVPADDKGRILRGLDCSGWINWVYWSATGKRLAGESTSSLCLCGEKISRSELKPGDIIVRTGTGAHVVMFLGWNADGRMKVIHESSASVNNVSVATMDAPWPYYRKLVE